MDECSLTLTHTRWANLRSEERRVSRSASEAEAMNVLRNLGLKCPTAIIPIPRTNSTVTRFHLRIISHFGQLLTGYSGDATAAMLQLCVRPDCSLSFPRPVFVLAGQAMEEEGAPWELLYNLGTALVQRGAGGDDAAAQSCLQQAEEACREV